MDDKIKSIEEISIPMNPSARVYGSHAPRTAAAGQQGSTGARGDGVVDGEAEGGELDGKADSGSVR